MAKLPIFQSEDPAVSLLQTRWASLIEPAVNNPLLSGNLIKDILLTTGTNQVNHKLSRKLIGWFIVRKRASSDIYDTQDTNSMPELTLTLNASANVTVDLYVF